MDFSFTEEQTMLRDMVQRFVRENYDIDARRKIVESEEGMSRDHWNTFAELGLLAAPFPEEYDGMGGSQIDTMVIMEELGRGLVVEPYFQTVVLGGGFIREGGSEDQKKALIPGIISGEDIYAVGFAEPQSRFNLFDITTKAEKSGDGYVLNGYKAVVLGGPWANKLIITARTSGGQSDEAGISVFVVDKSAGGVSTRDYPTIDGLRASEVTLENVAVGADALIGGEGQGGPLLEKVVDQGIAALCAEACGAMKVLNDTTVEYCKTREQFGQPIGKFQVLQHRMVDMFMEY
ncbi:MAG: pimeloyl-CoA dehydrogenase small subunit, partial [Alphaproteobacteria bacterium]